MEKTIQDLRMSISDAAMRLEKARENAGYRTKVEFAEKNGLSVSTYSAHENGGRGYSGNTAEAYGKLLGVSASWLLFGKEPITISVKSYPGIDIHDINYEALDVIGSVEPGVFKDKPFWDEENQRVELCPVDPRYPNQKKYCVEVRGQDMNQKYATGDILRCLELGKKPSLENGKRYIVLRTNTDGKSEMLARELRQDTDGSRWLWPLSSNPKYQTPYPLDDIQIRVLARIIGHIAHE